MKLYGNWKRPSGQVDLHKLYACFKAREPTSNNTPTFGMSKAINEAVVKQITARLKRHEPIEVIALDFNRDPDEILQRVMLLSMM